MAWMRIPYDDIQFDRFPNLSKKVITFDGKDILDKDLIHTLVHLGPGLGVYIPNQHINGSKLKVFHSRYYMAWEDGIAINITGRGIFHILGYDFEPWINDGDAIYRNLF